MRLLLDEHLSGRRIGTPLRRRGHDVEALDELPALWGMGDEEVLERGTASGRIVVTCNGRHFVPLARRWADEKRDHAGILIVWSYPSNSFGEIVKEVRSTLLDYAEHDRWVNLVVSA